ncbi:hypothetical protein VQ02_21425 [Methylobacterium variabile]|jgi:hypothetical protein|uniref:YgjV family protein n=1 Tax=Methylobacterium variabile TaxID=298794 RepID=A0A0J6SIK4_9HYPH|nr:YgjV family protein [Methylobacterium variabile]KMO33213.1 hypothetical protein VQ02_21425 [Methylobacterium variabile]
MLPLDVSALWLAAGAGLDAFGAAGLAFGAAAGLMPRRGLILLASAASSTCFGAHYLSLGSPTATAMSAVAVGQNLLAARFVREEGSPPWLTGLFGAVFVLVIGIMLATWTGWPSAFAGVGMLLSTAGRLQRTAQGLRGLFLGASLCWLCHNLLVGSVYGLLCDGLSITALTVALLRGWAGRELLGGPFGGKAVPA